MPIRDGKIIGSMTMYYDPFIPCHHSGDHEAMIKLGPAQFILPYMPDDARILFDSGIEQLGWRRPGEIEMGDSQFNVFDSSYAMFLAKEFGDKTLHAKVKGFVEATSQPKWDEDRGEFWWGYDLDEPLPRGQINAAAAMAEANSYQGWANLFQEHTLRKFVEPTIHGIDFPSMCLTQASYDVDRRMLAAASDAGLPGDRGKPTTFRVANLPPGNFSVEVDGVQSNDWHMVDGELEISSTIDRHTYVVRMER